MKTTTVTSDKKVEFEVLTPGAPDKLFIGVFGRAGTGKTRLMATAPGLRCDSACSARPGRP